MLCIIISWHTKIFIIPPYIFPKICQTSQVYFYLKMQPILYSTLHKTLIFEYCTLYISIMFLVSDFFLLFLVRYGMTSRHTLLISVKRTKNYMQVYLEQNNFKFKCFIYIHFMNASIVHLRSFTKSQFTMLMEHAQHCRIIIQNPLSCPCSM